MADLDTMAGHREARDIRGGVRARLEEPEEKPSPQTVEKVDLNRHSGNLAFVA